MGGIFISYRRDDTQGEANHLFENLTQHFGVNRVFMDVQGIAPGLDFRKEIESAVSGCDVLISMIGKEWLRASNEEGKRRLEDTGDFVGLETRVALSRNIPVIPVLVQGARMPRPQDLPQHLEALSYRSAFELRHTHWGGDVRELILAIEKLMGQPAPTSAGVGHVSATPVASGPSITSAIDNRIGDYSLLELLGSGGTGEVYRAQHVKIGRIAAIKVLPHIQPDGKLSERFINEARIHASLHHPNIVEFYEFADFQGRPCIIMEYVEGIALADRIRTGGALPLDEAIRIFGCIAEAIVYIHGHGVVHRDINSSNIRLGQGGKVKLLGFRVARDAASKRLTTTGAYIGAADYLAPEQVTGKTPDSRADIWSLGVLLYQMTTGQLPFVADSVAVVGQRICEGKYRPLSSFNPSLAGVDKIVERCLQVDPARRYASAQELLRGLRSLKQGPQPLVGGPAQVPPQIAGHTQDRGRWLLVGAAVVLVAVLGVAFFGAGPPAPAPPPVEPAGTTGTPRALVRIINACTGPAEIFDEHGNSIGLAEPEFKREYPVGERFTLVFRREGYEDVEVAVVVGEEGYSSRPHCEQ